MIPGIGAEAGIFLYAALAGVEAAAAYHVLVCFRKLVPHSGWAVSLEAVSYTHLDVYKRQEYRSSAEKMSLERRRFMRL